MQNIVHIGMHKTGSTFLQALLRLNRSAFQNVGIEIPNFGGNGTKFQARLFNLLADQPDDVITHALTPDFRMTRRIISVENLYQAKPEMIARLLGHLGEARVICFLRNPCDHIVSRYKQLVRNKGIGIDFGHFIAKETHHVAKRQQFAYYAYDERIAAWKDFFPDTRVASYASDNIVAKFLDLAELPPISLTEVPKEAEVNKSISDEAACLLVRLAGMPGNQDQARKFVATNHMLCAEAFAEAMRYALINLSTFSETFARHNPAAMERHCFQLTTVKTWPQHIAIPDEMIVNRIDELRRATSSELME
jgi:hypothetical protein